MDHRSIGGNTKGMQEYIAKGNIRIDPSSGFIEIFKEPTNQQYNMLRKFINEKYGEINISLNQGLGEETNSYYLQDGIRKEFEKGTSTEVILGTIKSFFNTGYNSPLAEFL
jgi:hypothetical protein